VAAAVSATSHLEGQDRAAVTHLLVSTALFVLGAALMLLTLAARVFPDALVGPLGYGRIQPMALTATFMWLIVALVGASYHVLPRLTGTRLWNEPLATMGGWILGGLGLVGVALLSAGLGDGKGPLGLPFWFDALIALALLVPVAVALQTIRARTETGVFPTLWFVAGGLASLPLLAGLSAVPASGGIRAALQEVVFTAGFTTLWVTTVGVGIGYYVAVRATGNPLSNRQLARAGFVSLLFAGIWAGPAQIAFAPVPEWLGAVAAALTLALPVAALANGLGIAQTVGEQWKDVADRPALGALGAGLILTLVVAITTSVATFETASALLAFTSYWDGILYLGLFGVGGMYVAAWAYQTLPAMTGRQLADPASASRHVRWTMWFVGGTGLLLMLSGIMAGIGTTGGAFGALGPDSWGDMTGPANLFTGLAVLTGAGAFLSHGLFALNVYRTLTSGPATAHEVLVERTA
jgi:cytochrome c oxidase cbb3-type subunit I